MSSPKPIQVPPPPHVKFTKDGRAYADIDQLIDSELGRTGNSQPATPNQPSQNGQQSDTTTDQYQNQIR